jgi:hypothetical protein
VRLTIRNIRNAIPERAEGYYDDVLSQGTIVGDELEITPEAYLALKQKYEVLPQPSPLPLKEKLKNLAAASVRWIQYGLPVVDQKTLEERAAICQGAEGRPQCDFWLSTRAIPQCAICGCGGVKHELASERCPMGKWEAVKGSLRLAEGLDRALRAIGR